MKKMIKFVFLFVLVFGLCGCGEKNVSNSGDNTNDTLNKVVIKDLVVNSDNVVALTSDNKLYALGKGSFYGTGFGLGDIEVLDTPTVIAENVKYYMDESSNTYYVDNNNNLYYTGLAAIGADNGGVMDTFKKIYSNVKSISDGMPYCVALTTNTGEGYIDSADTYGSDNYCGMDVVTDEFIFVASDIQIMFTGYFYHGYVTNNGDVYFKTNGSNEYVKLYENIGVVKEVYKTISSNFILTEDNSLYELEDTYDNANPYSFIKVLDNIVDIGDDVLYFKDIQGNIYFPESRRASNDLLISQNNGYDKLNISGIDKIYYADNNKFKYVYQGLDGKIHLYSEVDKYDLEPTIDNLQQILDFVK